MPNPKPQLAAFKARETGQPIRDYSGQVHCPCGTVIGLNLQGRVPPLARCHKCLVGNPRNYPNPSRVSVSDDEFMVTGLDRQSSEDAQVSEADEINDEDLLAASEYIDGILGA